ncbi:4559ce5b-cab0-4b26-9265-326b9ff7cca1 [Sclerotinia trifoliorum]|uniref:4559ce5b-cab0-4b26-9265-326b9ff7cca1 n=1 Tax=Sclerotinia trifoliorum TaxID=28548 RepID=A0A8H2W2M1_9HELO|nr:4559ce5b-cab0-4b26-9265-326b9ff7cca1 [Sclerotinia trifoliorum]
MQVLSMLTRQFVAVAIALLVQLSVVSSSNVARNDFMKNGIQEPTQEPGRAREAQGRGVQSRQCWNQTQQMQSQQSQSESSRTLLPQSLPTGQGQQPQSSNAGGPGQCFLPNGSVDINGIPCLSGDNTSRCCGSDEFCSTNRLCVSKNNANKFSRGSCADPTFSAASCPSFCQSAKDNGSLLPCGEPSLGQFCCDEGEGFACCSTPSKVFSVGRGTNFTEKYISSNVTSSSIMNFQPQKSSHLTILTNTDTATQTQTQIQISSATQTIVRTSVIVSTQIVTSIQTPTPTVIFPPTASTTVPKSIIFATQTTISQSQPSLSLEATPSASVFLNENNQSLPSSPLTNSDSQASTTSSSPKGNLNQNGQAGASTTSSQDSSRPSDLSLADNLDIQSTLTNLLKGPNMTAIIVGSGGLLLIVIFIVAFCCIRKKRRAKKSKDVIIRGSESQRGASKERRKKYGRESGGPNIEVFVTVTEKSKGRKGKAQAAYVNEDDRISQELDGALGGGSYLECGTLGREIKPANLGRRSLGRENIEFQNPMDYRDRSPNPFDPPPIPSDLRTPTVPILPPLRSPGSDYVNSSTIPILSPPTPIPVSPLSPHSLDLDYRISRASFASVTSGSRYSRMTTGEPFLAPSALDVPVPYRPVGDESRGVGDYGYGRVSRDEEQGVGFGRTDEQRQELPRGFF